MINTLKTIAAWIGAALAIVIALFVLLGTAIEIASQPKGFFTGLGIGIGGIAAVYFMLWGVATVTRKRPINQRNHE